jgi:hypothetical protein
MSLTREDELVIGQEYRIISGFGKDEVGVCRDVRSSDFGYVWGQIETPAETRWVRQNLLVVQPEPPKPEITTRIGVWMCPTCGDQGQFAGFCDAQHDGSARLVFRSCLTVEQVERARDEYIQRIPEASGTVDAFLKNLFDTPLLGEQ